MVRVTRRLVLGGAASVAVAATPTATTGASTALANPSSTGLRDDVLNVIEAHSGVSRTAILSTSREPAVFWARQRAMYVYHLIAGGSLMEIGRRFGGRSPVSAIQACRRIEIRRQRDPAIDREIDDLIQACIVEAVRNGHRLRLEFDRRFSELRPISVLLSDVLDPPWS